MGKQLLVAEVFGIGFLGDEGESTARFEDALIDIGKRGKALLAGSSFELGHSNELGFEVLGSNFAIFHQDIGPSFHELIQLFVIVEKTDDEIVGGQEGSGGQNAASDGVVVADDGILHSVGQSQEDDEVKGIQLDKLPFSGQAKHQYEEEIDNDWPDDFLEDGQRDDKHVFPHFVHGAKSSRETRSSENERGEGSTEKEVAEEDG